MSKNSKGREFLTTDEVAEILRVSPHTVYGWKALCKGPPAVQVEGKILYDREDLDNWIEEQKIVSKSS